MNPNRRYTIYIYSTYINTPNYIWLDYLESAANACNLAICVFMFSFCLTSFYKYLKILQNIWNKIHTFMNCKKYFLICWEYFILLVIIIITKYILIQNYDISYYKNKSY